MVSISGWLSGTLKTSAARTINEQARAADAWQRINDKPQTVTLKTAAGSNRAAQTVRIELDDRATVGGGDTGDAPRMGLIIYGIRNHATLTDTAMAEGDRFVYANDEYRCTDIVDVPGERQGIFEKYG